MTQTELYLPPPLTAHDAASILGKLGGKARAAKARAPYLAKAREIRTQLNLTPDRRLET